MFVAEVRGFGVDEMSYLTKSEKQMEFNMRKAQYYLGIQCSLSKGDGKEMKELISTFENEKEVSKEAFKKIKELNKLAEKLTDIEKRTKTNPALKLMLRDLFK